MSLRSSSLIKLFAAFSILGIAVASLSGYLTIRSFRDAEREHMKESAHRGTLGIKRLMERLASTTGDWCYWSDTLEFMKGNYDSFPADNLDSESMQNLDVDIIILLDRNGAVKATSRTSAERLDVGEFSEVVASAEVKALNEKTPIMTGLTMLSGKFVVFAAGPILTNKREGPSAGELIFAKVLTEEELRKISENIGSKAAIAPYSLSAAGGSSLIEITGDTISAHTTLNDFRGSPIAVMTVTEEREIYNFGSRSALLTVTAILILVVSCLVIVAYEFDRNILKRLQKLTATLPKLLVADFTYNRKEFSSADEIDILEHRIKELISDKNQLIRELSEANTHVATLSNLLPVCSWCKQVRDDSGYWMLVDNYLKTNMKMEITHGICPTCMEKMITDNPDMKFDRQDLLGHEEGPEANSAESFPDAAGDGEGVRHRRYPRIDAKHIVKITPMGKASDSSVAYTKSLGFGGCKLVVDFNVNINEDISLEFEIDGRKVPAMAKVIWKDSIGNGIFGIGVEFTSIDREDHSVLNAYVTALSDAKNG